MKVLASLLSYRRFILMQKQNEGAAFSENAAQLEDALRKDGLDTGTGRRGLKLTKSLSLRLIL